MHITQEGRSTAGPIRIYDSCTDRPPFSPVQLEGMAEERMCLSCSFEAVPYDSLVDMLFFHLPLGAKNNLAEPLNPALKSSSSASRRRVPASAEDDFSSSGTIHTLSRPMHSCTSST